MKVLDKINSPEDVKKLESGELDQLCAEIREFLIENVSKTGGHLSANLGVVELTVAIHRVFDTSYDRLVFDVGHQSYVHKILTGRKDGFSTLRKFGGIAGFPKPAESIHDAFIAGHASNSVSVALGMARARTQLGEKRDVIALIGDGALTGGLSYEALSDAGGSGEQLIVILNDNGMAIASNVGGMANYLSRARVKKSYLQFKEIYRKIVKKLPFGNKIYRFTHRMKKAIKEAVLHCSVFEDMGFSYYGPVDGHDIGKLVSAFQWAKHQNGPVLIHTITKKGKGYSFAEKNPDAYHGVSSFDPDTGVVSNGKQTFSSVFGSELVKIAESDNRVCAITAAMTLGTGLTEFSNRFPDRFFDVGIAEAHGTAMAAGMASIGSVPVLALYSTFLQRAYDMLIHDIAISHHHVVIAVDRAGITGEDGETHQGVFDVAYLSSVPGMEIWSPSSFENLKSVLTYAVRCADGPVAVRYPRGGEGRWNGKGSSPSEIIKHGSDFTIVTYGIMVNTALEAAEKLESSGVSVEIVKLGRIKPIEYGDIISSVSKTGKMLVLEDVVSAGGVGEQIAAYFECSGIKTEKLILKNLGDSFTPHGSVNELYRLNKIDADSIKDAVLEEK